MEKKRRANIDGDRAMMSNEPINGLERSVIHCLHELEPI